MTPAIPAALAILTALLCLLAREIEALWTDRPVARGGDTLAILSGGLGLLAAALVWGAA